MWEHLSPSPLILIEVSYTNTDSRAWVCNCINVVWWDVIIYPSHQFNGPAKPPLKLENGQMIKLRTKQWTLLPNPLPINVNCCWFGEPFAYWRTMECNMWDPKEKIVKIKTIGFQNVNDIQLTANLNYRRTGNLVLMHIPWMFGEVSFYGFIVFD